MFRPRSLYAIVSAIILLLIGGVAALMSQTASLALIHEKVDESKLVTLSGNTRPEANPANDAGPVADDFPIDHMILQLKRSPQREKAVQQLIADLHNPASPNFHKWLGAGDFGRNYGLAESDIHTITGWLESHGFTVNSVYPNGTVIDFSGTAGQLSGAFHTTIHYLNVNGVPHIANFSDPQIPQALTPAIAGILSLHDFRPHKMSRAKYTFSEGGQTFQAVVPADLAAIYDFIPLFAKGITGSGQTIAVLEDTNLYTSSDWTTFRSTFGLSQYSSGSLATVHPASGGTNNCLSPGVNSDDSEAILDAEWASAAAPGAAIEVASCASSNATFGVFIAGQNLVNSSSPPPVISISYGACEAENGAAGNTAINALYQQAVAEGISVFVAAGDEGAASCDAGQISATHGIGVSSSASTQYNVAVGGTDFADVIFGNAGKYWSQTNSTTYGSALSYIPEMPWNDSCAGALLANFMGYSTGYGPNGFCNSNAASAGGYNVVAAGSGGPSNCFSGVPLIAGTVSGSCQGYPKPSWQTGLSGIPNDGVRDIPDVSLFAADGVWGHYSVTCFSDPENGGVPCRGAPSNWAGFGGTSVASPEMAGIQALVDQSTGVKQGNPNYVYYALALSTPSVFHSIPQGDIAVNCGGPYSCYDFVGNLDYGRGGRVYGTTYAGGLSVSTTSYSPAYPAGAVWSFANGIGSVDVNNLVTNWK